MGECTQAARQCVCEPAHVGDESSAGGVAIFGGLGRGLSNVLGDIFGGLGGGLSALGDLVSAAGRCPERRRFTGSTGELPLGFPPPAPAVHGEGGACVMSDAFKCCPRGDGSGACPHGDAGVMSDCVRDLTSNCPQSEVGTCPRGDGSGVCPHGDTGVMSDCVRDLTSICPQSEGGAFVCFKRCPHGDVDACPHGDGGACVMSDCARGLAGS